MKLRLRASAQNADMTAGSPLKLIIAFGIPILIGNIFQQFYTMVDSIIVGNYVSADALAAVSSSSNISHFLISATMGLTTGASIAVSQLFGARRNDRIKAAISTTLLFMVALSLALSVAGAALAGRFCLWLNVPENIMADSVEYLRIYMIGIVFMVLYNFFASILRAMGDSTTPLIFLVISSVLNILGDLWFVVGLGMRVAGVAWATVLSQAVSVVLCTVYVYKKNEYFRFSKGEFVFDKPLFKEVLRLGLPSALQGSVMSLGFLMVQSLINSFGSTHMAAYAAASKMEMLAHLPVEAFAMAFSVYVGQNMGAGNVKRTKEGMWKTFVFCAALCVVMAIVVLITGESLVSLFVDPEKDENAIAVIEWGARFLRTFAPFTVLFAAMNVINSTLRGSGDSFFAMIAMMLDLLTRMVMAYFLCSFESIGFMGIAWSIPCGWLAAAAASFIRYLTGRWQNKTVKV